MGAGPGVVRRLKAKADAAGLGRGDPDEGPIDALAAVLVASWFADDLAEQRAAAEFLVNRYPDGDGILAGGGRATLGLVRMLDGDSAGAVAILQSDGTTARCAEPGDQRLGDSLAGDRRPRRR